MNAEAKMKEFFELLKNFMELEAKYSSTTNEEERVAIEAEMRDLDKKVGELLNEYEPATEGLPS